MTNPDYTAVGLCIDRSGSMAAIKRATQDAINEFIKGQALSAGKRTIRIDIFDDSFETVVPTTAAADVAEFVLEPRGMTALYDGIARSVDQLGAELSALPEDERPGQVVLAIMTDGMENASTEHTSASVKAMLERQQSEWNWNVLFMGANQDAVLTAQGLGIPKHSSISYAASNAGSRNVLDSMDSYVVAVAAGAPAFFSDEDREEAMQDD